VAGAAASEGAPIGAAARVGSLQRRLKKPTLEEGQISALGSPPMVTAAGGPVALAAGDSKESLVRVG
jgi:hypothetical protein